MPCDTFVILSDVSLSKSVIFGKNSDRPVDEVQEVVFVPKSQHATDIQLRCTHISIPQIAETYGIMISKPSWLWGAEMGANENGVVIGNEAVWSKLNDEKDDLTERLLGMDLVRLGLERGRNASHSLDIITSLLQQHGQGGPCYEKADGEIKTYYNSYIICDKSEAWVLETIGGHRNISNRLSIGSNITKESDGLRDFAKERGLWDGSDPFNFSAVFGQEFTCSNLPARETAVNREKCGNDLLSKASESQAFQPEDMFAVLRNEESGICRTGVSASLTTASQVSVLPANGSLATHWFTATPNPNCSVFKPFIFAPGASGSPLTVSPSIPSDRKHDLYRLHMVAMKPVPGDQTNEELRKELREIECACVKELQDFLNTEPAADSPEFKDLFSDAVEVEYKFYQ